MPPQKLPRKLSTLMMTVPHSGEVIPPEANWLKGIDPLVLLTDVDRFVDQLYGPASQSLQIPMKVMEIHRYVVDLNRLPSDVDASSVSGAPSGAPGAYASGFHWVKTTRGQVLLSRPLSPELHEDLVNRYFTPFHRQIQEMEAQLVDRGGLPRFHLDVHSMPSVARGVHRDAGQTRPDVVVSDCSGRSCSAEFKDRVIQAFEMNGFRVTYNWPYLGGRMTETYGKPQEEKHSIQIELNRALYMDEETKEKKSQFSELSGRLTKVLNWIQGQ